MFSVHRRLGRVHFVLVCAAICSAATRPARAVWSSDGNAVRTGTTLLPSNTAPQTLADGAGGAFIVWAQRTSGTSPNYDIYAARISSAGVLQWGPTGVCTVLGDQTNPRLAGDGGTGFYITWDDRRSTTTGADIYAARLSSAGALVAGWPLNGKAIAAGSTTDVLPAVLADGAGGAIIAWTTINGGNASVLASRVTGAGAFVWAPATKLVADIANSSDAPTLATDGAQGAYVGFQVQNWTGRVQHISSTGLVWSASVIVTSSGSYSVRPPVLVADGAGGVIAAFMDNVAPPAADVAAVRVGNNGTSGFVLWYATLCDAAGAQQDVAAVTDGAGGAVAAWQDQRGGGNYELYAQRAGGGGSVLWTANGVLLASNTGNGNGIPLPYALVSDKNAGAAAVWQTLGYDILGRHITSCGSLETAVSVCTNAQAQEGPGADCSSAGKLITAWRDQRTSGTPNTGVFANEMAFATPPVATLGVASGTFMQLATWTGPANSAVYGAATAFELRQATDGPVTEFNWDQATTVATAAAGAPGTAYCFPIYGLNSGTPYYYALRTTCTCGSYLSARTATTKSSGDIQLECNPSKADAGDAAVSSMLRSPSPSPAVSHSRIEFRIAPGQADTPAGLVIVNVAGRVVRRFDLQRAAAGDHAFDWDLRSDRGERVANGIYYARLSVAGRVLAKPIVVQR